jgi:hypothetical protein
MSDPLHTFMVAVQQRLVDDAEAAMHCGSADPFQHGVQVGHWRGLKVALEMLVDIINESDDKE